MFSGFGNLHSLFFLDFNMRIKYFFLNLIIVVLSIQCNPIARADRLAKRNQITTLYPETKFDKSQAELQLARGKSTIKGVLYKKTNKLALIGGKSYGYNVKVVLFPVNNYLMDWYELRKRKESKRTYVYLSDEAYSMRLETTTDNYGRFNFTELKPGKYFLQAIMSVNNVYSRDVVVGTNSYGTQFYQKENYTKVSHYRNEKFVEITSDGELVEVRLK